MATTYNEIISLDEGKNQLGIPTSDTTQDARIQSVLTASLQLVEKVTGLALIDRDVVEEFIPDIESPVLLTTAFSIPDATGVAVSVTYAQPGQARGNVVVANEAVPVVDGWSRLRIYPADGRCWPAEGYHFNARYSITTPAAADIPESLKAASLLIMDQLFSGSVLDAIPERSAVGILLSKYTKFR